MSFPNPPIPDQEYTHSNGITYIYDAANNSWEIKYEQATNTASLPLANPTRELLLTGSQSLPDADGLLTQSNYNEWLYNSLVKVDETSRVDSSETAPADADTNQLWYKPSTGSLYVHYHDGNSVQWVEIGGSASSSEFVKKVGGDSMEGPLNITGQRNPVNGIESTLEVLNVDSGQSSTLNLKWNGETKAYLGDKQLTLTGDLKFNTANKHIYAGADKKGIEVNSNGVLYKGDISANDHLITKEYSDLEDQVLDAKITELRVEMDALAPIDASGVFRWQDVGTLRPPAIGQFILLSEDLSTPVQQYGQSGGVWVHQTDWENVAHDFTEVHVGELIQLFDRYEPEFVLGEITEVQTGGLQPDHSGSLLIKYDRISSVGGPDYGSGADPLVNLKVYRKPTDDGTGESAYLPVKGGTMQGAINMEGNKIQLHGENSNKDHIHFTREPGTYINAVRLDHPQGSQVNGGYDIRLIGHSSYNWLRLCGLGNGDSPLVTARASGEIKFVHDNIRFNNNKLRDVGPAVSDTDAVNLGQIKERLAELRDEFLQDLIVGTWGVDNVQSLVTPGTNRMCFVKSNGQGAQKFSEAVIIRFFYQDDQGSEVLWDHWDPGELITFRQLDDPSVTATFRLQSSVNVNGNTRSFPVEFLNAQNDNNPFGQYLERYAVTLTEFSDGFNGSDLDTLYYRVDGSNGPLVDSLTVSTNNEYGASELILEGRRDNPNNAAGVLKFTNTEATGGPGEISYYTHGGVKKFTFNENVDFGDKLLGLGNIQYVSGGGEIKVGTHARVTFQNPSKSGNGLAAVHVSRAPGDTRRTFAISGKNTSGTIEDIFYCYTKGTGDYVVYKGDTSISNSVQTKNSVQALIDAAAFAVVDGEGDPHFGDHRLEDVGVPVAATDAATKGYVDANFVNKTGLQTQFDVNSQKLYNALDPVEPQEVATKNYVDNAVAGIGGGAGAELEHTPYIANMSGTKSGTSSINPGYNQVVGFYTSGTGDSANQYPGNFNSFLMCGAGVVSIQQGTNEYAELPGGHNEYWTGTVSVINLDTGGLLYKNTMTRVTRNNEYVWIWVRDSNNSTPKKPMFAYGNVNDWTNISVIIDGYRAN